ncbi:hypothetical protein HBH25_22275 [Pseudomonas sp. hsmgli-8]|uniref:Uncharacterized protein n=1 Tax=Pseudomonas quercus TaxID=2722792 RepID=A0ABX0YNL6_9PSED|nr:hypothetical protein [Pseudomonas quercus]NJP03558.1 hypothetical protein [Pseudomonas quercus]
MAGILKIAGLSVAASLAVPVAGISGLATAGLSLALFLAMFDVGPASMPRASLWQLLTSETTFYLLIALAIFILAFKFLSRLHAACQALVGRANSNEGLTLDASHLLGHPAPVFAAFDTQSRKLAVCSVADDTYSIHDFSWVLGWQITWREVERMEMNGGHRKVSATGMSVPTFGRTVRAKDFAIELQVADTHRPLLEFPMSRRAAELWCARLGAIFS